MIKIGLTGNRYSGKDITASLFKGISIPVFNADVILKFLINHNFDMSYKIKRKIDKSFFTNDELDLTKLTGPVLDEIIDIVEYELFSSFKKYQLRNANSIYTIFHSSILFERDWNKKMDYSISVFSPISDRVNRSLETNNIGILDAYSLAQREMKDLSKNSISDFIIHNYNDDINPFGSLSTQVNDIDKKIIDKYLSSERKFRLNGMY
jgi:dephospho-CoA kinase